MKDTYDVFIAKVTGDFSKLTRIFKFSYIDTILFIESPFVLLRYIRIKIFVLRFSIYPY